MSTTDVTATETLDGKPDYSFPEAAQLLSYNASAEDWTAERSQGVGGSDASIIMGENRYRELLDLYEDKVGLAESFAGNYLTRRGHHMEDLLRQEFSQQTGIETQRRGMLVNKDRPYMRANVDSLTADGGIFEAKVHGHWLQDDWSEEEGRVSTEAYWQVQHNMAVTGRSHAWVVADIGGDFKIIYIERDDHDIADLIAGIDDFWHYHVLTETPPKPQRLENIKKVYSRANLGTKVVADDEVVEILSKYRKAKEVESKTKELLKHYELHIRGFMENAETLVDEHGVVIATNKQNGTFKEADFRKNHPDVAQKYVKQVDKIDTQRLKKANEALYTRYRARVIR